MILSNLFSQKRARQRWVPVSADKVAGTPVSGTIFFNSENYPGYGEDCWFLEEVEERTNCYNYALNLPHILYPLGPGYIGAHEGRVEIDDLVEFEDAYNHRAGTFKEFEALTKELAVADGLIPVESGADLRAGYHLVALLLTDHYETPGGFESRRAFHWLRLDKDGIWSGKAGAHLPGRNDGWFRKIRDPEHLHGSQYDVFGGYFLAPDEIAVTHEDISRVVAWKEALLSMTGKFGADEVLLRAERESPPSGRRPGQSGPAPR